MGGDIEPGRIGQWQHTYSGGKFFPADPRPEEVKLIDIANGLSQQVRYSGQGRVDRFYSVGEHCLHLARWALAKDWPPALCLVVLLHDASEAYIGDLPRAVKAAVGQAYTEIEGRIQAAIWQHFGLTYWARVHNESVQEIDRRIILNEKLAVTKHPEQRWEVDDLEPLDGVEIHCLPPEKVKSMFVLAYGHLFSLACNRHKRGSKTGEFEL